LVRLPLGHLFSRLTSRMPNGWTPHGNRRYVSRPVTVCARAAGRRAPSARLRQYRRAEPGRRWRGVRAAVDQRGSRLINDQSESGLVRMRPACARMRGQWKWFWFNDIQISVSRRERPRSLQSSDPPPRNVRSLTQRRTGTRSMLTATRQTLWT
jgi:hypothetical protein